MTCISSCSDNRERINPNNCNGKENIYTFKKGKNISFKLDSATSPNISYVKFKKINDSLFYIFLNSYTNTLYAYYYENKSFYKSIKLSASRKLTGFEIITWDKIITYAYRSNRLELQNESGEVLKSISLPPSRQENGYDPMPKTYLPIIHNGDETYIAGAQLSRKRADDLSKIMAKVNDSFTKRTYLYNLPRLYNTYFFGGANYRFDISYAFNSKEKLFVFSFPASHKLFTTKDFNTSEEFCAGSEYIESIPNYPSGVKARNSSELFKFCAENGIYEGVLYDEYNDLYYRLCLLPTKWGQGDDYFRDLSIIILDKNFKIVGEKRFKNTIDFEIKHLYTISVSPEGLLIQQKNNFLDEDFLNFTIYNIVKI